MFGKKVKASVLTGTQVAEVVEMTLKIRTAVGEFSESIDVSGVRLIPDDSFTFTWKWNGFGPLTSGSGPMRPKA